MHAKFVWLGSWTGAILVAACVGCGKSDGTSPSAETDAKGATASIPGGPAKPNLDPLHPMVVFETTLGNLTVRLDAEKAPITVDNFLTYLDQGHYNQTMVHQVFQGQGFIGGGFGLDLSERPTRPAIRNEAHNGLKNRRGTVAMVRSIDAIDSGRSQFFFNVADNESLDHKDRTLEGYGYCVFGEVVSGADVLDKIGAVAVHDTPQFERTPTQPVVIKSVRRSR
jgi:cyclophilin family peptidyl-prolyl cis-trans isomerase